jgi:hypothetical protein
MIDHIVGSQHAQSLWRFDSAHIENLDTGPEIDRKQQPVAIGNKALAVLYRNVPGDHVRRRHGGNKFGGCPLAV